jgi:hypothetical protein
MQDTRRIHRLLLACQKMLSSAIPARLEFQCGHAALVSLPRIKGETSAQRNERVALEKRNARGRVCDFCAPRLEEVAQVLPAAAPPVEVVSAAPPSELVLSAAAPHELVVSGPPPPEPVVPAAATPAPVVSAASPSAPELPGPPVPETGVSATPPALRANGQPVPARRKLRPRPRAEAVSGPLGLQRFEIRFQVERVLQATNIRDALRQAESLGAAEVLAVTLEGGQR